MESDGSRVRGHDGGSASSLEAEVEVRAADGDAEYSAVQREYIAEDGGSD